MNGEVDVDELWWMNLVANMHLKKVFKQQYEMDRWYWMNFYNR